MVNTGFKLIRVTSMLLKQESLHTRTPETLVRKLRFDRIFFLHFSWIWIICDILTKSLDL